MQIIMTRQSGGMNTNRDLKTRYGEVLPRLLRKLTRISKIRDHLGRVKILRVNLPLFCVALQTFLT